MAIGVGGDSAVGSAVPSLAMRFAAPLTALLLTACSTDPSPPAPNDATSADTGPPLNTCHLGVNRCTLGTICVRVGSGQPRCVVEQTVLEGRLCDAGCQRGSVDAGFYCAPLTTCGLTCTGLLTNREHCGACYSPCVGAEVCRDGECRAP